jgi:Zn-dependent protease with chaperone function
MKNKITTIILIALFLVLLTTFISSVVAIYPSLSGKVLLFCNSCLKNIIPIFQKTIFIFFSIAFVSLTVSVFKTVKFGLSIKSKLKIPVFIEKIATKYSLQTKLVVFEYPSPVAFCMGILNPKIYLSDCLVKMMTPKELETIIIHEKQHLNRNDNLVLLILQAIKNMFFFLPIIGDLVNYFHIRKEILADRGVISELGNNHNLISALRKVVDYPALTVMSVNTFSQSYDIETRVLMLLGDKQVKRSFPFNNLIISLSVLLLFANVVANKVELHSQTQLEASICLDDGNCQNICQ